MVRYVPPEQFDTLAEEAKARGFKGVASGPYVRSSFNAERLFLDCKLVQLSNPGNGTGIDA